MDKIASIQAFEVLDSRGTPTVMVEITTENNFKTQAFVPSGASTGQHEALEKRDQDPKRFFGKGVSQVIQTIETTIAPHLQGMHIDDQQAIDQAMIDLDGTANKSRLGANAILGISLAVARAAALSHKMELYAYLNPKTTVSVPLAMMNVLNGGAHADNDLDFQEFMIMPYNCTSFQEALRMGSEIFHALKEILKSKKLSTSVGDEGGFAPQLSSNEKALDLLIEACTKAQYTPGKDVLFAIDAAASEFFNQGFYIEKKKQKKQLAFTQKTSSEQIAYLEKLCANYPIFSIEDGLDEEDWSGWSACTKTLGKTHQIVGDDLFVTNPLFLKKGIELQAGNAILIKLNQIGTLTETLQTIQMAKDAGFHTIISHRSGETEDPFIADLAIATNAGQIKTGSLCRSERTAKYNRLVYLEKKFSLPLAKVSNKRL